MILNVICRGRYFFIDKCVQRVYNYGDIKFYERRDDMKKQITAFLTAAVLSFGAVPAAETVLPDSVQTGISASAADNAPAKVKGVKASSVTQTTALLSWNSVSKAKGYRIYVYDAKAKKYTKVTTVKSTAVSYKLIGLTPDTEYKYKVRAYKKVNDKTVWGTASEAAAFTTKTYAPAQVKNVKASAKSASKIKLSWGKVTNAKGYRIYKYNDSTKKFEKVTTVGSGTTSYTVSGLSKGKSYKFKVRAYRKVSGVTYWGKPSTAVSVTTKKVDEQMAQELRQAGEEEFYDMVEFAQMYNWSAENIKVLRETDTQYGICVEFYSPLSREILVVSACKVEMINDAIQVLWCNPFNLTVTDSRGAPIPGYNYTYDNFEYRKDFGKDRLITLIKDYGYTN